MQQMWPTGSGQYMENTSGNSQEALGINTSLDSYFIATWTF